MKLENQNFSYIIEGIELEKENLSNQNTILKTMLSSQNPDMKFSTSFQNAHRRENQKEKFSSNKLFFEMLDFIKNELKKLNPLDYKDYDKYFEIIQQEYNLLINSNNDFRIKQKEFLDFLTNIQESIEVKNKNLIILNINY